MPSGQLLNDCSNEARCLCNAGSLHPVSDVPGSMYVAECGDVSAAQSERFPAGVGEGHVIRENPRKHPTQPKNPALGCTAISQSFDSDSFDLKSARCTIDCFVEPATFRAARHADESAGIVDRVTVDTDSGFVSHRCKVTRACQPEFFRARDKD